MEEIVYGENVPREFWVVAKPSDAWDYEFLSNYLEISDICYRTSYRTLIAQSLGGFRPEELLGVFREEQEAKQFARSVLKEYIAMRQGEKIKEKQETN